MRKVLICILVLTALSACGKPIEGNSIVIGAIRESFLLGSLKIYAIDETGTLISFSSPFSGASNANWSPDHQWVTYQTEDTAKPTDPDIFIVKSDGTKKFALTNDSYPCGFEPAWSPDGSRIAAYLCDSNDRNGIYMVDVSCITRGQDCVFNYQFIAEGGGMPSWSPNGKQLAFWTSSHQIFVVSIDSPEKTKQITPEDIDCYEPAWSPVGDEIAMRCFVSRQGNNIFLVNSDGSDFRNISNTESQDGLPTWSPDGTKIAFASNRAEDLGKSIIYPGISSDAVYVINDDGTNVKRLSSFSNERIGWLDWLGP